LAFSVTAGVPLSVTVTARDATGAVVPGYRGTVHFTAATARRRCRPTIPSPPPTLASTPSP
jgi:hypothetical protein